MKKYFLILSIFISLLFLSCYTDTGVLYNVRGDVKSEKAEVCGNIRTITRYNVNNKEFLVLIGETNKTKKDDLFAENRNSAEIFYKPVESDSHGDWITYDNKPCSDYYYNYQNSSHHGEQMLLTHATEDTLYIVTAEYKNDTKEGSSYPYKFHIYGKQISLNADGTTWNEDGDWVDILDDVSGINYLPVYKDNTYYHAYHSAFALFSTNAIQKSHRKVYLRRGDVYAPSGYDTVTYYELSGLNAPSAITVSVSDSSTVNNANSVAYFNNSNIGGTSNYKFFNALAATTNETSSTDATMLYYSKGEYIYYMSTTDTQASTNSTKTGEPISTLAVCKDALLIGRADYDTTSTSGGGGITKFALDSNGIPASIRSSFDTNAELQLSSTYFVLTLLNTDPSLNEKDSTIYASLTFIGSATSTSINSQNVGLWSYYKNRGNWNRE